MYPTCRPFALGFMHQIFPRPYLREEHPSTDMTRGTKRVYDVSSGHFVEDAHRTTACDRLDRIRLVS